MPTASRKGSQVKTLFRMVVVVLLLAGWGLAALSLHVIRTPQTVTVVPKNRLGLSDTFVDTREWTLEQAGGHARVVERLIEVEKAAVLQHLAADASETELVRRLRDAVEDYDAARPGEAPGSEPRSASAASEWIELAKALDFAWDQK